MARVRSAPSVDAAADFADALGEFFLAARRARGRSSRREQGGLSLAQFHLLEPLLDGQHTVGQLADEAGVSAPTATRMLDGASSRGWARRAADASDRRLVKVSLTPEGRRATLAKRREVHAARRRIATAFDEADQRRGADLLRRMSEVIEEL
jgi:DNA-binding MarR family transcriptional regulator